MEPKRFSVKFRRLMVRMSLQWKIAMAILLAVVLVVPSVSMSLFYFTSLLDRLAIVIDQDVKLGRTASELSLVMRDIRRYERNYRLFGASNERERVESLIASADSILADIQRITPHEQRHVVDDLIGHLGMYNNTFLMLVEHVSQNPPESSVEGRKRMSRRLNEFQASYRDILEDLETVTSAERDSIIAVVDNDLDMFSLDVLDMSGSGGQPAYINENLERSRQAFLESADLLGIMSWTNMQRHRLEGTQIDARAKRNIISILIVTFFACIIMVIFLPRYIVRPIRSLIRVFKKAQDGDLSVQARVYADDEIGDLARSFNRMLERLRMIDGLKTGKIASQKRAFDRFLENLDEAACILTNDFVAVYYNARFAVIFGEVIPPKPPDGGLDLGTLDAMHEFNSRLHEMLEESANNFSITFADSGGKMVVMKGRFVRNSLMKLESVVLVEDNTSSTPE